MTPGLVLTFWEGVLFGEYLTQPRCKRVLNLAQSNVLYPLLGVDGNGVGDKKRE